MAPETGNKIAYLICFVVISLTVTGYFIGLQSPMNPAADTGVDADRLSDLSSHAHFDAIHAAKSAQSSPDVIPATHYADMARTSVSAKDVYLTSLAILKIDAERNSDLLTEVKIIPEEKTFALALRNQNRSFNGAPPTVPHPIDQMSAQACVACHSHGIKTETLRIPRMSHQFLENCTQCHVENSPQHMPAKLFRETQFVGLPAPTAGPRAFAEAPPQIPHSTWMRVDCMSCHGPAGLHGIRTTHPWRQNCQQCHAPSSELDQVQIDPQPKFLPPIKIK